MKFSIIVPVYNVEKYITMCIESLLKQDYEDYEILLIDDGSTDNSGKICERYSLNYSYIKTFHKENSGLSDARNLGIEKAKGDYIIFVDSDDYIQENILKEIANTLKDGTDEILITRLVDKFENYNVEIDNHIALHVNSKNSKYDARKWILEESKNTWPAQKYIVSKKFLEKNNLKFRSGFLHEDIEWTSFLCIYGEKFNYFEPIWYYHRKEREGSITNVLNEKRILDVIQIAYDFVCGKYSNNLKKINTREKKMLINRIMKTVYFMLKKCKYLDENKIDVISNELMSKRKILNSSSCLKHRILNIAIKLFGLKNTINYFWGRKKKI